MLWPCLDTRGICLSFMFLICYLLSLFVCFLFSNFLLFFSNLLRLRIIELLISVCRYPFNSVTLPVADRVAMLLRRVDVSDGMRRLRELSLGPVSVFDWSSQGSPIATTATAATTTSGGGGGGGGGLASLRFGSAVSNASARSAGIHFNCIECFLAGGGVG